MMLETVGADLVGPVPAGRSILTRRNPRRKDSSHAFRGRRASHQGRQPGASRTWRSTDRRTPAGCSCAPSPSLTSPCVHRCRSRRGRGRLSSRNQHLRRRRVRARTPSRAHCRGGRWPRRGHEHHLRVPLGYRRRGRYRAGPILACRRGDFRGSLRGHRVRTVGEGTAARDPVRRLA